MATKFPAPKREFIEARFYGGKQVPKGIVIHGTVSSDNVGTARAIANMWAGPRSPLTSASYVVDPREDIQCVGDHRVAYHCGFNTGTIAIELCDEEQGPASRWRDADSRAILKRAARLTAELCLAYDIEPIRPSITELKLKGPHGIYGHDDSRRAFGHTTHTDPRDFDWAGFLKMVREEITAIKIEKGGPTGFWKDRMTPREYFVGARGRHVTWLTKRLVAHGKLAKADVTDRYTEKVRAAVRSFQLAQGWKGDGADGIPGRNTLNRLAAKPKPAPRPGPKPAPLGPKPALRRWNGFVHLLARFYQDYASAVVQAAKKGVGVDVDVQSSKDGTPWALHWAHVGQNKLHDPRGLITPDRAINSLTDDEVARLRGPKGQRTYRLVEILDLAAHKNVRVEMELKSLIELAPLLSVLSDPSVGLLKSRGLLQVKTLAFLGDPIPRLAVAKAAGLTTILLFEKYNGPGISKDEAWPVTDYVRGTPKWR